MLAGHLGVSIFFALSGFCLYYPLVKRSEWKPDWKCFYIRRALRIYPAYLLSLAIMFPVWLESSAAPNWAFHLVTHLSFTFMFFRETAHSINGVLWSLGTEENFYMLFPLIGWLAAAG